jgi:hypothetical protein
LTAAIQPGVEAQKSFKQCYQAILAHYGLQAQAIQDGKGNENGNVEQSHHQFKRAVDQALMLRGQHLHNGVGISLYVDLTVWMR